MVIEPEIFEKFNYKNTTIFEKDILTKVAKKKELIAFKHKSFWQCMDTLRDKITLNDLYRKDAPWKK